MTVDGTDCPMVKPMPFDTMWFSHIFHGPAVGYEVGFCIGSGFIAWVNGRIHCGINQDIKIFNQTLKNLLQRAENVYVIRVHN